MVTDDKTTGGGQTGAFDSLWRPYSLAEELAICARQYGERLAAVEQPSYMS